MENGISFSYNVLFCCVYASIYLKVVASCHSAFFKHTNRVTMGLSEHWHGTERDSYFSQDPLTNQSSFGTLVGARGQHLSSRDTRKFAVLSR